MAINSLMTSRDKIPLVSLCSLNSSKGSIIPNRLVKLNFATDSSIISSVSKSNRIRKNINSKSPYPYLNDDKVHLPSRVSEKRVVQKKAADFVSSFPLAVTIYKANSDEFKSVKQNNKRAKKSVLTLPNEQAPTPQTCTVSDMNDSEDFNNDDYNRKKRPKKRPAGQNRRSRNNFEFYDRDARYCSQFNINLDRSSTDVIRNFNGDGKKSLNRKKQASTPRGKIEGKFKGQDVWRVLRNINRFQFPPSPPMSEEDFNVPLPRKKDNRMRYDRKDTRFIETCRTEEFAYISSIEVDSKSPSFSHSSSFDRITVIDKEDEFSRICEEFEKTISKTQSVKSSKSHKLNRNKNKSLIKKSPRSCNTVSELKKFNQTTIPTNGCISVKHSSENSSSVSNYSGSLNKDTLNLNAHNNTQKSRNKENLIKSILKNDQIQNINGSTEINSNYKSSTNTVSSKTGLQNTGKGHCEASIYQDKICNQPINGITKVILSKGEGGVPSKRVEISKRKPRLATTLTNVSIVPKMTQNDIRRRLLNMKFPLVILGKDQVSSTIELMDYDAPQFEGLDKHIWPFMVDWNDDHKLKEDDISESIDIYKCNIKCEEDPLIQKINYCHFHGDNKFNRPNRKVNISGSNQPSNRERKWTDSKLVSKKTIPALELNNTQEIKKPRPIRQLKDKMLKLLYKKPLVMNPSDDSHITRPFSTQSEKANKDSMNETKVSNKIDVCVKNNDKINSIVNVPITGQNVNPTNTQTIDTRLRPVPIKRPWAKAKWASDFIENVIKKIKNGVYYSQDVKYESMKSIGVAKEASVQTRSYSEKLNKRISCDTPPETTSEQPLMKKNDLLHKIIPGFDKSLPELEVQTLDANKIEIKNCLANIIVQFDITVLQESDKLGIHTKKSCSLIPLEKDNSNIKLFKCKATILNAMLPAELCAILPDMMRKIVHSDIKSSHSLPINKTDSQLSTISELSHFEAIDPFRTISRLYILSPEIRRILSGKFSDSNMNRQTLHRIKSITFKSLEIVTLLPKIPDNVTIFYVSTPMENIFKNKECTNISLRLQNNNNTRGIQDNNCKILQPYNYQKQPIMATNQTFSVMHLFENMWNAFKMFGHTDLGNSMRMCTIFIDLQKNENITKNVIIKIDKLKLDSIFENYAKMNNDHHFNPRAIQENDYSSSFYETDISISGTNTHKRLHHNHGSNHKIKRKGFVKLYKKCKSTSNIPTEKSNFSLSKITNLDDFFQLLGSKSISCVFDGNSGKKILSSIVTMKNWITEINSRQAILVLLLANKKDTPNLIRLRPVLLQGIAVNRITRASELDMEIEVIEREKLNGFSQFDGISYLPASIENKDNLLEELNWIAKTTASDYQKPFDESSEKLLKSLLEKRKQLNPSYLRVMARYVGLGLLKSPTKKINLGF